MAIKNDSFDSLTISLDVNHTQNNEEDCLLICKDEPRFEIIHTEVNGCDRHNVLDKLYNLSNRFDFYNDAFKFLCYRRVQNNLFPIDWPYLNISGRMLPPEDSIISDTACFMEWHRKTKNIVLTRELDGYTITFEVWDFRLHSKESYLQWECNINSNKLKSFKKSALYTYTKKCEEILSGE